VSGRVLVTRRREFLAGCCVAVLLGWDAGASAMSIHGVMPWEPDAGDPPVPARPGPWQFFTPEEGAAVEALVDRLIPPDPQTPGGKDTGVAIFIDRQLAGSYGSSRALYVRPPFMEGTPQQGPQSPLTPAMRYRKSLAALAQYCHERYAGKAFREIADAQKDQLLADLESGRVQLTGVSGKGFFELLLRNAKEGFFADPIYGGNRNMVGWKMIGFPGARYDYRDWVERHNERFPLPPVGLQGRPAWTPKPA
jgi:gluconate 2-dehydrogenase gamma chain